MEKICLVLLWRQHWPQLIQWRFLICLLHMAIFWWSGYRIKLEWFVWWDLLKAFHFDSCLIIYVMWFCTSMLYLTGIHSACFHYMRVPTQTSYQNVSDILGNMFQTGIVMYCIAPVVWIDNNSVLSRMWIFQLGWWMEADGHCDPLQSSC